MLYRFRQQGFTLLELMVTLFIASILVAVAVPSFQGMNERNRLTTYTNDFIATINLARSEAVRRGAPVTICPTDDGEACAGTWDSGWIVFADTDGDGVVDNTESVLRVHEGLATQYAMTGDAAIDDGLTYAADGSATAGGVLAICHDGKVEGSRAIIVTSLRPRVARDSDGNGIPNLDADNDIDSCDSPSGT